jgi:hypothetical protein
LERINLEEVDFMAKCPFVDRECTEECKAYDTSKEFGCLALHLPDRANKLLNYIEKKVEKTK